MPLIGERVSVSVKKILFATDFSEISVKALSYAKALAHRYCAEVEVVHVFDPSMVQTWEEATLGLLPKAKRKARQEELDYLKLNFDESGLDATAVQLEGHRPTDELLKFAKEDNVDLILAGTTAKSGLARLVLGSTAEQLIRRAPCPVMTIGPNVEPLADKVLDLQTIVFATDLTPESAKAATFALSFAEDSGSHLFVCHVLDTPAVKPQQLNYLYAAFESIVRQMVPQSSYDWCSPECVVEQGDVAQEVLRLAAKVKANLIVVGARKYTSWLNTLEPGVIPTIWASATCPVLSVC